MCRPGGKNQPHTRTVSNFNFTFETHFRHWLQQNWKEWRTKKNLFMPQGRTCLIQLLDLFLPGVLCPFKRGEKNRVCLPQIWSMKNKTKKTHQNNIYRSTHNLRNTALLWIHAIQQFITISNECIWSLCNAREFFVLPNVQSNCCKGTFLNNFQLAALERSLSEQPAPLIEKWSLASQTGRG